MKELRRRKGLSGTVLIMILTVMVVLIIMLMATLTVVTTANQRVYTKFEENQAYYSARSALDIFTQNMFADKGYYAYNATGTAKRQYLYGDGDSADMKQGLGLQLDLYAITAQSGENIAQSDLTAYANGNSGKDEYKSYFGTDAAGVQYVEYAIELPKINDESADGYGKLSDKIDVDGDGVVDNYHALIRVEVLDRTYNLGTYNGNTQPPVAGSTERTDFFADAAHQDWVAEAIANGSRKKDTMRVKITATAYFDGQEATAVLLYDTNEPPTNNSSRAITAFGAMNGTNHAYIIGGVSMVGIPNPGTPVYAPMNNGGGVYGTVYDEVGLDLNVNSPVILTEMEYIFIGENLKFQNSADFYGAVTDLSKDKRPFVFVSGDVISDGSTGIPSFAGSTDAEKVDLIINGNLNWTANAFNVNGDVYCNNSVTFNVNAGDSAGINGDMYVKGNFTIGGNYLKHVDSTYYLLLGENCGLNVSGDIYSLDDPTTAITASCVLAKWDAGAGAYVSTGKSIGSFNASDMVLPSVTDIKTSQTEREYDIKLPGGVTKKIETHKTNYDEYYYIDGSGNYVDAAGTPSAVPVHKSAQDLAAVNFTDISLVPTDHLNITNQTIDTAGGTTQLWYDGSGNGNGVQIEVTGGGTLELYLYTSGGGDFSFNNGAYVFIVDDDTTLKVFGVNSGITYNFDKVRFLTRTVYDALQPAYGGTNAELNTGSEAGHNIKVPKIYYYFDGGQINLNNSECFFTGYIFAPDTKLYASGGSSIKFNNLKYNGVSVNANPHSQNWVYTILGSVLCNDFEFQNNHGVIYVNPALADDGDAGEPIHAFNAYRYTRS